MFPINQLLDISPKMLYFFKPLIQSFYTLKYGLLIKILRSLENFTTEKLGNSYNEEDIGFDKDILKKDIYLLKKDRKL